ncbi:MAG: pur operon repressor [Bacillales bacterium]|jgi:purine operon repressor|nr:pur operon repressor [Bacillales bacterium]
MKRSHRLVDLTYYLLQNPQKLIPLTYFAEKYDSAKSSISEDLSIVKTTLEEKRYGTLVTVAGASGGVKYIPIANIDESKEMLNEMKQLLENSERLLPGGYLYISDLLGDPRYVNSIGRIMSSAFIGREIDCVMTVATKGIPIAYAVASNLNKPVIIVKRDSELTEGSTVNVNYISGSTKRIQTMVLSKRALAPGTRVLIIDDFMKAGGTINGMITLLEEFGATVAGIGVFIESEEKEDTLINEYISLLKLKNVDIKQKSISIDSGNYILALDNTSENLVEG